MPDPVISPDGKFMWTGTEWIPAPPASKEDNSITQSSVITDSVMMGDIVNIVNNPEDIAEAIANKYCSFCEASGSLTFFACKSAKCDERYCDYCPSADNLCPNCKLLKKRIGEIDRIVSDLEAKPAIFNSALETVKSHEIKEDYFEQISSISDQKSIDYKTGTMRFSIGLLPFCITLAVSQISLFIIIEILNFIILFYSGTKMISGFWMMEQNYESQSDTDHLWYSIPDLTDEESKSYEVAKKNISNYSKENTLQSINQLYRELLNINRIIYDEPKFESAILIRQGNSLLDFDLDGRHRCFTEAVKMQREFGIPIQQWFIDNGY